MSKNDTNKSTKSLIAKNAKARHEYHIVDVWEAGVSLLGTEVKALRDSKASLVDSYATVDNGEVWLRNMHIGEYDHGTWTNHSPRRARKLLLHKSEIGKIFDKSKEPSYTLIPLSIYFLEGRAKVELALAKGKQLHDKRQALAEKTAKRETDREIGRRQKGNY